MKSVVLDTNAFLRFLLNDVPAQAAEVSNLFNRAKAKQVKVFIPQIVLFEIHFALDKYYKLSKDEVIQKLGTLLATQYLKIQDKEVFKQTLEIYKLKNLDFVDCFIKAMSKETDSRLFTFDKNLKKLKT